MNKNIEATSFENWLTDEMRRAYNVIKVYDMVEPTHIDEFIGIFEKHINTISSTVLRIEFNNILNRYVQNLNMFTEQDKWEQNEIDKMFVHTREMLKLNSNLPEKSQKESNSKLMLEVQKEILALPEHKRLRTQTEYEIIASNLPMLDNAGAIVDDGFLTPSARLFSTLHVLYRLKLIKIYKKHAYLDKYIVTTLLNREIPIDYHIDGIQTSNEKDKTLFEEMLANVNVLVDIINHRKFVAPTIQRLFNELQNM